MQRSVAEAATAHAGDVVEDIQAAVELDGDGEEVIHLALVGSVADHEGDLG